MKTINNYISSNEKISSLDDYIIEKLIITKDTKEKSVFYNFSKSQEVNKILSICGFNDTNYKPSKKEINTLEAVLYDIEEENHDSKLMENKTYYALLDTRMYNILDNKYGISQYKDYIEIDNDKFDKLFDNRYDHCMRYSIEPDYSIHKYFQSTNILYYDTRDPDDGIYIFFIMK